MKNKLTQEYLKECLHYDPETGIFTWNERPFIHFKNSRGCNMWNTRFANKSAGCTTSDGYLSITINSKLYKSHRLAFLFMGGYIPENQVDHIDRNRLNNKWSNLREVSNRCNLQNCNLSKNNTPLHMTNSCVENDIKTTDGYEYFTPYKHVEEQLKNEGFDVLVFVPSIEEDKSRITCGNAILGGSKIEI